MQIKKEQLDPTSVKLTVTAIGSELAPIKQAAVERLGAHVSVSGFRPGKTPIGLIEKQLDPNRLQAEFLDSAVNQLFIAAVKDQKLKPVSQPSVSVTAFVPFESLTFSVEVPVVGEIKLGNYKQLRLAPETVTASAQDVKEVLESLRQRAASRESVTRAAQLGDEVLIDFTGSDVTTKKPIDGGSGADYTLLLGSKTFIPGFEDGLVGLKAGEHKDLTLRFPKDYGVKTLQSKQVKFAVSVKQVSELVSPKLDDNFAATVGPFKTLSEAKEAIKKDLIAERQREAQVRYDNTLLTRLIEKSAIPVPGILVDEEVERIEEEEKRNVAYQGQTWQQHLDQEGVTAEEHKKRQRPRAEERVKAGLALAEVAEQEAITVTPEELEVRIMLMRSQYSDPAMLAELDKPENRRDIQTRLLTEKTLDTLKRYATVKK